MKDFLLQPIAHRGLHDNESPENSLSAFAKAIERGYAIELDVHMLADGEIVVFHDKSLLRMTGRKGDIISLKKEDLDEVYLANSDEHIPLFQDVLSLVNGRVPLLIEIKNSNKVGVLEERLLQILKDYSGSYAIQSFNPFSLRYFYKHAPQIPRGQLSSYFENEKLSPITKFILKRLLLAKRLAHADFISYDARHLPNKYTSRLKLPLIAWTINSREEYEKKKEFCDNIIFQNFLP